MPPFDDLSFDTDDPLRLPSLRLGKKQRVQSLTEPYDQQTQEGLLDQMLGKSMGFLQYLGETLDKPGRAVRGLLGGKPSELANLIPFSDTIGLTDPQQSVSGRDLLEQYGVLDKNTPGLDWGDAAGFAADVLLDPTTYVGLGGLTAAGKVAKGNNALTKGLGAGIRAGERGLFDVGLPFTRGVGMGTGETAAKVADYAAGVPGAVGEFASDWIPGGKWAINKTEKVGRELRRNFDPSVGGTGNKLSQEKYAEMVPGPSFQRTVDDTTPLFKHELDLQSSKNLLDDDYLRAMRDGIEGLHTPGEYAAIGKPHLDDAALAGAKYRPMIDKMRTELQKYGIADDLADEFIEMAPRYHHSHEFPNLIRNFTDSLKKEGAAFGKGRLEFLKNLPDGTNQVNDFFKDPDLWDLPTAKLAAEKLMLDHNVSDPEQALSIAQWVRRQDKQKYLQTTVDAAGVPTTKWTGEQMFNASPVRDLILYSQRHAKKVNEGNFIHEMMKSTAKQLTPDEIALNKQTGEWVNVKDAFEAAGLNSFKQKIPGVAQPLRYGAMPLLASNLGLDVTKPFKSLQNHFIPVDVAKDITEVAKRWKSPETLQAAVQAYDAGLTLFKGTSTQLWPGFHSRNFLSGMYYNVVSGAFDPSMKPLKAAYQIRMGQELTPEMLAYLGYASKEELLAELLATGTWKQGATGAADAMGTVGSGVMPHTIATPGPATNPLMAGIENAKSIGTAVSDAQGIKDKLIAGAGGVIGAGGKVGSATEDILRINQFLSRKVQGWTAEAASLDVKRWLFNYDQLTQFERNVMKRAIPFYSFMRFNTPLVLKQLLKKPGGALGQSIRAANFARQDQGYLPEHIGEGLAIPFPGNPDRYITGIGLPFENLLPVKFANSIDQTIRRSGEAMLSQMTPAITAPYSLVSGREPFFGRENKELYPYPFPKGFPGGQTLNILANKVIGRPFTEIRKATDDRKGVGVKAANLFTGVKISDLSGGIERQKALEASRVLKDQLDEAAGVKSTEHFYLDPANKGKPADSEAIKLLKLKRGLEKHGKAQAKKNRSPYEDILLGNL